MRDDPESIVGQKYCLISFISPDNEIEYKNIFGINNFLTYLNNFYKLYSPKVKDFWSSALDKKIALHREKVETEKSTDTEKYKSVIINGHEHNINTLLGELKVDYAEMEKHVYQHDHSSFKSVQDLKDKYDTFCSTNYKELDNFFGALYDNACSYISIKVRGIFDSKENALEKLEEFKQIDKGIQLIALPIGKWCPWTLGENKLVMSKESMFDDLNAMLKRQKFLQYARTLDHTARKENKTMESPLENGKVDLVELEKKFNEEEKKYIAQMKEKYPTTTCPYLMVDKEMCDEQIALVSVIFPEKFVQQRTLFYIDKFMCEEVRERMLAMCKVYGNFVNEELNKVLNPKKQEIENAIVDADKYKGMLNTFLEIHSVYKDLVLNVEILAESCMKELSITDDEIHHQYKTFMTVEKETVQTQFAEYAKKCLMFGNIRGIKIRGLVNSEEDAQVKKDELLEAEPYINVVLCEIAKWVEFDPMPDKINKDVYGNETNDKGASLNELVKPNSDQQKDVKRRIFEIAQQETFGTDHAHTPDHTNVRQKLSQRVAKNKLEEFTAHLL